MAREELMDYTQPFCTIGSARPFKYSRYGYLPALEAPLEKPEEQEVEPPITYNQLYSKFQQVVVRLLKVESRSKYE